MSAAESLKNHFPISPPRWTIDQVEPSNGKPYSKMISRAQTRGLPYILAVFQSREHQNTWKNRGFGQKAAQSGESDYCLSNQGASEDQKDDDKPTPPRNDSSGCFDGNNPIFHRAVDGEFACEWIKKEQTDPYSNAKIERTFFFALYGEKSFLPIGEWPRDQNLITRYFAYTHFPSAASALDLARDFERAVEIDKVQINGAQQHVAVLVRTAAEQGYAEAQYSLGIRLGWGLNIKQDPQQGIMWLKRAAEQGHLYGRIDLARLLEWECDRAPEQQATQRDLAEAEYCVGLRLEEICDNEVNLRRAVEWYRRAAKRGHSRAQTNLGVCFYAGRGVGADQRQAVEWFRRAAEQGYAKAQNYLGVCLADGRGVGADERQAVEWFRRAAEQGYAKAQNYLGVCLADGRGVGTDQRQAVEWFRRAAEQGNAKAQLNLGLCLYAGRGVGADQRQAVEWFRRAAEQGNVEAQYRLGACLANGDGVAADQRQAVEWYKKAAEQGNAKAQFNLGVRLDDGDGIPIDRKQAVKWFGKAAEQGHTGARDRLGAYHRFKRWVLDLA